MKATQFWTNVHLYNPLVDLTRDSLPRQYYGTHRRVYLVACAANPRILKGGVKLSQASRERVHPFTPPLLRSG